MVAYNLTKGMQLENLLNNTFKQIEEITDISQMTNAQLKQIVQRIEVDKDGNVEIFLRLLGDLGLPETALILDNRQANKVQPDSVLNNDNRTNCTDQERSQNV